MMRALALQPEVGSEGGWFARAWSAAIARESWIGLTPGVAGRWISLFFVLAGALALFQSLLSSEGGQTFLPLLALVALIVGAAGTALPWERNGAILLPWTAPVTCGFLAFALLLGAHSAAVSNLFVLLALWIGLFRPLGSGVRTAPWILAAFAGPLLMLGEIEIVVRSTATTVAVSIVVAEVISRILLALTEARAEAERVATIFRTTSVAARRLKTLNPDGVCQELVDAALNLGFDAAAVNVVDRRGGEFAIRAARGFGNSLESLHQSLSEGVSGEVLARGRRVVVDDYGSAECRWRALDGAGIRLVAGVPVVLGGEVGAVLLGGSREGVTLPPYALDALELLASDAAVALENARAFQQQRELAHELGERSLRDPLTGLANRRAVDAALTTLADGDCVIIIDLDHFKAVNDSDGHAAGDAVIVRLAQFLQASIRSEDLAARWGGEEFLVILRRAGDGGAVIAKRLLERWRAGRPRTSFSAGVAVHREGMVPADTLQMADAALYRAKRLGRDRIGVARERLAAA